MKRSPHLLLLGMSSYFPIQHLWKRIGRFPRKLRKELLYDPAIPLTGIQTFDSQECRDNNSKRYLHVVLAKVIVETDWRKCRRRTNVGNTVEF